MLKIRERLNKLKGPKLFRFDCPDCGEELRFMSLSPMQCRDCFMVLPDVLLLMENDVDKYNFHFFNKDWMELSA